MGSLQFHGMWPTWLLLLIAIALSMAGWLLYYRESRVLGGPDRWLLPTLRSTAILLTLLMLLQPSCHRRWQEGAPASLNIVLDLSESMSVVEPPPRKQESDSENQTPATNNADNGIRLQRADEILLAGQYTRLQQWAQTHQVSVQTLIDQQLDTVWSSNTATTDDLPISVMDWQEAWGSSTSLGVALQQWLSSADQNADENTPSVEEQNPNQDLLLLLSDGQNNAGPEAIELASRLNVIDKRVFAIGLGPKREDRDLAITNISTAKAIYFSDLVTGSIEVQDRFEPENENTKVEIQIQAIAQGETEAVTSPVLWQSTLQFDGSGVKNVAFSFAIQQWIESLRSQWRDVEYSTLPVTFVASLSQIEGERTVANNQLTFQVAVGTRRQRVLLVDGRSRWESRFLRNSLERDPNWQVDSFLWDQQGIRSFSQGRNDARFPESLEDYLNYDLIILGEISPQLVPENVQGWLSQFVAATGGGLIVIDGQRKYWNREELGALRKLLPVETTGKIVQSAEPMAIQLSSIGNELGLMQLDAAPQHTADLWQQLPGMKNVAEVRVLPGGETLANLQSPAGVEHPYLVTRLFGAGRVFYVATDESWRWRYGVEDKYHQRFWNQVARWVMRSPFMANSQWLSLDTGQVFYQPGETIQLRARLMQTDGQPSQLESIDGVVTSTASESSGSHRVQMLPVPNYPGVYQGQLTLSQPDSYSFRVSVPGYQQGMLDLAADFSVEGQATTEWMDLTCNQDWLEQLCNATGGKYVHETDADQLTDLISAASNGKFVEDDTLLWQSYMWFIPIVVTLGFEWWRRKQVGLI